MLAITQESKDAKINDSAIGRMTNALEKNPDYLAALTEILRS